jgi:hypothetical protein
MANLIKHSLLAAPLWDKMKRRPSWILSGAGFSKGTFPNSEAQPTKKFQVYLPISSCITIRNKVDILDFGWCWFLKGTFL